MLQAAAKNISISIDTSDLLLPMKQRTEKQTVHDDVDSTITSSSDNKEKEGDDDDYCSMNKEGELKSLLHAPTMMLYKNMSNSCSNNATADMELLPIICVDEPKLQQVLF